MPKMNKVIYEMTKVTSMAIMLSKSPKPKK